MRKKVLFVLTIFGMMATAIGVHAEEVTMEEIVEANDIASILDKHENILIEGTYDGASYTNYVEEDLFFYKDGVGERLYSVDESCIKESDEDAEYLSRYINLFGEDLGADWKSGGLLSESTAEEEILSWEEEEGCIKIVTRCSAEQSAEIAEAYGTELADGEYYSYEYDVDAETYYVLASREYTCNEEGEKECSAQVTMTVGGERPEMVDSLIAEVKAINDLPEEETRTVTCVLDPGTEEEKIVTQTVRKGNYVMLPPDLHGYGIYADAEGTTAYEGSADSEEDFTLYLIPSEE